MKKFGTGSAQSIWKWYNQVWAKQVRDRPTGSNPFAQIGGVIITLLAMIIMIIGVIITGIIDAVVALIIWFGGLFNDEDDDRARAEIGDMTCDEINALTETRLNQMTRSLLDNYTGDDDENALIKIVTCLDCTRLRETYWPIFGSQILSDTHGDEYDRLRAAMHRCLPINFSDWDDDASRVFIENSTCPDLRLLFLEDIKILLSNLFRGTTGSAEEWAIIKLIECLDDDIVQVLVSEPGFSVSDFDDEVDRGRWDRLVIIFREKGVSV